MDSLFEAAGLDEQAYKPLADQLRPQKIEDVIGQEHLLGENGAITISLRSGRIGNTIFWGPPGTGKTTVARLIAENTDFHFEPLSAIFSGVQDLRKVFERAKQRRIDGQGTLLFIDEIHRFNRSQQDSFLPHMEDGTIVLIGATTENPSFELNSALLSRSRVLIFQRLNKDALGLLLRRAEEVVSKTLPLTEEAQETLLAMADGDGRTLLNLIDELIHMDRSDPENLTPEQLGQLIQRRAPNYDKGRDGHYNLISALHKSVRGSDPDAALYWLARMLVGGEDPLYLARRFIRMASEDIGLADPHALQIALSATEAYRQLGSPEGELALAQACLYLSTAPKSNAVYKGMKTAMRVAKDSGAVPPPPHILNAPTALMKAQGYGQGYIYDHDTEFGFSGQSYFPEELSDSKFYRPYERGFEREIKKRISYWTSLKAKYSAQSADN